MIFLSLLIFAAKLFGGFLLAHLVWGARDAKSMIFKLFLGAGIGIGISSLLYFLWMWFNLPSNFYPDVELALFVLLLLVVLKIKPFIKANEIFFPVKLPSGRSMAGAGLVLMAIAMCIVWFSLAATQNPHGVQDAWTIWNASARFIYGSPSNWLKIVPQNAWFHPDYPLLVSLNVSEGWSIVGSDTTRIPIALALIFILATIGLLYAAVAMGKDREQGMLAAIVISSLTVIAGVGATQYADLPLAYFFLATGALLYLYTIRQETGLLILAGLMAGLSGWTKNEGLTFMIICLLAIFVLSIKERRNLVTYLLSGMILPVLVILLFKTITPPNDLFVNKAQSLQQLFEASRYALISSSLVSTLYSFGSWPVSFVLIFAGYALLMRANSTAREGQIWLPVSILLLQFVCYFVIYLITPLNLANQLKNSLDRLLFHLLPLTLFSVFVVLLSPSEILTEKNDPM